MAPDDEEIFDIVGEWSDIQENGARVLTWHSDERDLLLDVHREGATRLEIDISPRIAVRDRLLFR
nr:hypothetical protein [Streptomyces bauhiniae]